jgi:hypothetical protein
MAPLRPDQVLQRHFDLAIEEQAMAESPGVYMAMAKAGTTTNP